MLSVYLLALHLENWKHLKSGEEHYAKQYCSYSNIGIVTVRRKPHEADALNEASGRGDRGYDKDDPPSQKDRRDFPPSHFIKWRTHLLVGRILMILLGGAVLMLVQVLLMVHGLLTLLVNHSFRILQHGVLLLMLSGLM